LSDAIRLAPIWARIVSMSRWKCAPDVPRLAFLRQHAPEGRRALQDSARFQSEQLALAEAAPR
jgi:hypothetical protein